MIRNDYTSPALGVLGLLITGCVLFVLGGLPGLLFGLVAATTWILVPPAFAFAVGQAGVAAVATPPYPPLLVIVEIALLAVLVSDTHLSANVQSQIIPALGIVLVAAGAWGASAHSLAAAAVVCLAGLTTLIYAVHRYELLITDQLTEASS